MAKPLTVTGSQYGGSFLKQTLLTDALHTMAALFSLKIDCLVLNHPGGGFFVQDRFSMAPGTTDFFLFAP